MAGKPWVLLARGPWPREAVSVRLETRPLDFGSQAQASIEHAWRRASEEAAARGATLFPGEVAGLAAFRSKPGELALELRATDYRAFVGTNLSPEWRAKPREVAPRADALGISIVVLSGTRVLLHRRGERCFEHPLSIDTPGGHVEPSKHVEAGAPSPFLATLDELEAELGVLPGEVLGMRALALTRIVETEKPQLVVEARIALSPDEVSVRLEGARERFETSELLPVEIRDLARLALSGERITPAGRAAMTFASELSSP